MRHILSVGIDHNYKCSKETSPKLFYIKIDKKKNGLLKHLYRRQGSTEVNMKRIMNNLIPLKKVILNSNRRNLISDENEQSSSLIMNSLDQNINP